MVPDRTSTCASLCVFVMLEFQMCLICVLYVSYLICVLYVSYMSYTYMSYTVCVCDVGVSDGLFEFPRTKNKRFHNETINHTQYTI